MTLTLMSSIRERRYKPKVYVSVNLLNQFMDFHCFPKLEKKNLSLLSMPSPYPGVSTIVKRSLTPLSSISTVEVSIFTVLFILSVDKKKYSQQPNIIKNPGLFILRHTCRHKNGGQLHINLERTQLC